MTEYFFRSDFDFLLNLKDITGAAATSLLSHVDFDGIVRATGSARLGRSYHFGKHANECMHCYYDSQSATIRVICDHHSLGVGELSLELAVHFADPSYPDGTDTRTYRLDLPIELTADPSTGNYGTTETAAVTLPYVYASAYDLAVTQGYTGTAEQYWTATLDIVSIVEDARQTLQQSQTAAAEAERLAREAGGAIDAAATAAANANAANEAASRATENADRAAGEANTAKQNANDAAAEARAQAARAQALADAGDQLARRDRNNNFSCSQTVTGNLTVQGDIVVNGETYVVQAEEVRSANDRITMRDGAVGGLGAHAYSGFEIVRYNGADNCLLAVNAQGEARVGDYGMGIDDTQPLLTREETANLRDGDLLRWDASRMCAVPLRIQPIDLEATFEDDPEHPVTYWLVSLPGYVPPTNPNA